jgi:AbrB family looped-hinge helix DNA binding protein
MHSCTGRFFYGLFDALLKRAGLLAGRAGRPTVDLFECRIAAPGTVPKAAKEDKAMSHRLTIKGQVTIPKEIRDFLGLEEGNSSVEFAIGADGKVTVTKALSEKPRTSGAGRRMPMRMQGGRSVQGGGVLALLAGGW